MSSALGMPVGALPAGSVIPFAGSAAPAGWLMCGGQAVSRTTYAALFAVIGTTYGSGDGSTTFTLPDMRGRSVFGKDDMGGSAASRITSGVSNITGTTLGATGGDQNIHSHSHANSLTNNAVTSGNDNADHTHTGTSGNDNTDHSHAYTPANAGPFTGIIGTNGHGGTMQPWSVSTGGRSAFHQHSTTTGGRSSNHQHSVTSNVTISNQSTGAGNSQNMPPTIILNYIIKAVAF
jgi:microcystin-dependent protein